MAALPAGAEDEPTAEEPRAVPCDGGGPDSFGITCPFMCEGGGSRGGAGSYGSVLPGTTHRGGSLIGWPPPFDSSAAGSSDATEPFATGTSDETGALDLLQLDLLQVFPVVGMSLGASVLLVVKEEGAAPTSSGTLTFEMGDVEMTDAEEDGE